MIGVLVWLIHDRLKDKLSLLIHVGVDARGRDCAFVALAQAQHRRTCTQVRLHEKLTVQYGPRFIHSCAFLEQLTCACLTFHGGVLCVRERHPNRCQDRAIDCVSTRKSLVLQNEELRIHASRVVCVVRSTRNNLRRMPSCSTFRYH